MKKNFLKYIPIILIVITSCKKEIETIDTTITKQDVLSSVVTKQNYLASYVPNELLIKFKKESGNTHRS